MSSGWLVKRLTQRKAEEPRWVEFATALQTLWEELFDPEFASLENLRSVYTASESDLNKKIREYGDYFAADMPRIEDRPVAVAWRKRELEFKDTEEILTSVFKRHFAALIVEWVPLYASKLVPYGEDFISGDVIADQFIPSEQYYLTSRGVLSADLGKLHEVGLQKEDFIARATTLLKRTIPLHLVHDGFLFFYKFPIEVPFFPMDFSTKDPGDNVVWFDMGFSLGSYDQGGKWTFGNGDSAGLNPGEVPTNKSYPADVRPLDLGPVPMIVEQMKTPQLPFMPERMTEQRLDRFARFDEIPADYCPLDMPVAWPIGAAPK